MSLNYLLPSVAAGVQLKQHQGTIRNSFWKTMFSNPFPLFTNSVLTIPISFVLRVTDVTNVGALNAYLLGTSLMFANLDGFMGINQFLSGASPANKDYTFYQNNAVGFGTALGEITSNVTPDYDIYLYSTIDDPLLIIADTPYVLTYFEITF
jgi:hypothetical protein